MEKFKSKISQLGEATLQSQHRVGIWLMVTLTFNRPDQARHAQQYYRCLVTAKLIAHHLL